jgi:hypothetical protein
VSTSERPILRPLDKTRLHRILVNIAERRRKVRIIPDITIEVIPGPEGPGPSQQTIGGDCRRPLQPLHDLKQGMVLLFRFGRQTEARRPHFRANTRRRPVDVVFRLLAVPRPAPHGFEFRRIFVQPADETLEIVPGHVLDRPSRALEVAWILAGYRRPERLGASGLGQPETAGQDDLMLDPVVIASVLIVPTGPSVVDLPTPCETRANASRVLHPHTRV